MVKKRKREKIGKMTNIMEQKQKKKSPSGLQKNTQRLKAKGNKDFKEGLRAME